MKVLADAVCRAVPRLQLFRVGLGELDPAEQFVFLLLRQIVLPIVIFWRATEDLPTKGVKPMIELSQIARRQCPNPIFQFLHTLISPRSHVPATLGRNIRHNQYTGTPAS